MTRYLPLSLPPCVLLLILGCANDRSIEQEIQRKRASYSITAADLFREYEENGTAADAKYKGKVLVVSGRVANTGKTTLGAVYIIFSANNIGSGVDCRFAGEREKKILSIRKGSEVTVRGRCEGKPLAVLLRGCKLIE